MNKFLCQNGCVYPRVFDRFDELKDNGDRGSSKLFKPVMLQ